MAWWQWPNLLSLDAPIVAMVWLWIVGACERMVFLREIYAAVFLIVWGVYLLDRIIDAWRTKGRALEKPTARHDFYRRNWAPMMGLLGGVGAVAVWLILFRVPQLLLMHGLVASSVVWLYLALNAGRVNALLGATAIALAAGSVWLGFYMRQFDQVILIVVALAGSLLTFVAAQRGAFERSPAIPKEVMCGLAFALGIGLPAFVYNSEGLGDLVFSAGMWSFGGVCVLNCLAISVVEESADREAQEMALPQIMPEVAGKIPWMLLAVVGFSAWTVSRGGVLWPVAAAAGASGILLLGLYTMRGKLGREGFRVLADVALLTPLAFLPMLG